MGDRPTGGYVHSSVRLRETEAAALERLARELGMLQQRGAGAGNAGSISRVMRAVAAAYERDPDATRRLIAGMISGAP